MAKEKLPKGLDAGGHRWELVTKTTVGQPFHPQLASIGVARRQYKTLWCVRCGQLQFMQTDRDLDGKQVGEVWREYRAVGDVGSTNLYPEECAVRRG